MLEETNIDIAEMTSKNETCAILACKYNAKIEILESLLVSMRTQWPIEQVKEFLDLSDSTELRALDYCKAKKRSDLAVVLNDFVDSSKSVLEIDFSYVYDEKFDVSNHMRAQFVEEISSIKVLDS